MKMAEGFGRFAVAALMLFAAAFSVSVSASGDDHERALQAMQAGEIKPLAEILSLLASSELGRVVEVELEQKRGRWIYEFKLLEPNGLVREVKVDARNGDIVGSNYDD